MNGTELRSFSHFWILTKIGYLCFSSNLQIVWFWSLSSFTANCESQSKWSNSNVNMIYKCFLDEWNRIIDSAQSVKSPILFAERCTIARRKRSFDTLNRFQRLVGTPIEKRIVPDSHCFVVVEFLHVHSRWMSKQNGVQEIGLWEAFWLFWSMVLKVLFLR